MLTLILGFALGAVVIAAFFFLGGQLIQQRRQVLEMRKSNVDLFQENQNLKMACAQGNAAYENLRKQVEKIQAGPIAAALTFEQVEHIAGLCAAKVRALMDNKTKLLVN